MRITWLPKEADIPEVDRTVEEDRCTAKGLYTNDIQRLYKVASAIVHISQQDLDLSTYIGQIASLKEEFLTVMPLTPDVGAQQTQLDKFFMVLTLIGLRPDLEPIRDQILGSSSVPSLDDVFARLLRISSTQTLPLIALQILLFTWTASSHCPCGPVLDSPLPQPPSSSTSQASVASVAQPGNASACLTHTSSLGPWILDSGASDHLSGNKDLFSSITTTSALPNVTLAKGPEYGKTIGIGRESQGLYHLTSDSSPAVCISTDAPLLIHNRLGTLLGKHTRVSFPKRLNNRAKSPFELVHTDVWGPCRTASTLGFQYFVTFIDDYSRYSSLPSLPDQPLYFLPPRVFGCTCFVHILTPGQDKLSAKAMKCLFLGYSRLQKGYRCYSLETHRYFISADVTFFEDSPFFSTTSESLPVSEVLPIPIVSPPDAMPRPLQVYHRRLVSLLLSLLLRHLLTHFLSLRLHLPRLCLLLMTYPLLFGKSTHEALSHPGWRQAMVDEMAALHSNGTWDLVVLPSGKSTVSCRWVYAVKVGPDGQVDRLKARLVAKGYTQCIYLVVYVDDIVITDSDQDGIQKLKQHLFTHFQTKDLGKLKYFLGIEIAQSSSGVVLSQRKYALDILEETGMLDCKPVHTPMDPNVKLVPGQGELLGDPGRYRRLVGQGVLYENRGHTQVIGYTDADWAGSPTDRRSTSGYCVFIGELRFGKDEQMKLICDNQAALHIASNPVFHERTKHIEVDCHFIREKIASGCVATSFVNSNDQLADIFTKSLRGPRIKYICNKLGAYDVYAPA
ncbi:Retrovirus-related Pol polyprotein from transposon RE1 [Vitis vinifera]|uniref:Retrovirus-related Pol polyprotein from transposon RE1 n=1 Tax=Vitis vinifera TaxID=29760 RepID=A0A438KLK3_VITVI|nr:Retrovirus-related Pol polyprotein from transposon RE1 [Vitis vinifera]